MTRSDNRAPVQLLTVDEVAELLREEPNTIHEWVIGDKVPYVATPDGLIFPMQGLLMSLSNVWDLAEDLRIINKAALEAERKRDV